MRPTLVISTAALAAAALSAGLLTAGPANAGPDGPYGSAKPKPPTVPTVATTIGQAGGTLTVCNGTVPAGLALGAAAAGAPTYVAPFTGVVTSYTTVTNNKFGQVRAVVLGAGATPDRLVVTAKSPKQTVALSKTNTFPAQLRMLAGQHLGLGWTVSGMACAVSGVTGDVSEAAAPFDPDLTADFVYSTTLPGIRPNISAVLEPDKDNDGFGDITQDACPKSALSQVACPTPNTHIKKRVRLLSKHRVKLKFVSTVVGSTFQCSIDGRKFHSCRTPYKKRLAVGEHELRVRAVSPAGLKDHKPARVSFRIR